jgi:Transmembrane secretion effector
MAAGDNLSFRRITKTPFERHSIRHRAKAVSRIVEVFLVASWLEHLRQHERVTNADRLVQECVHTFQLTDAPKVIHFVTADVR